MKHALRVGLFIIPLIFLGCDAGSSTGGGGAPPTATPPPSPPPPGAATIGAAGGTVTLPSVAEITFPAGSVPAGTQVAISRIATPTGESDFVEVSRFLSAANISLEAVEVSITSQPGANVQVRLNVGAQYTTALPSGHVTRVLALSENSSALENAYPTYEILPVTINVGDSTISFEANPIYFARRLNGRQMARFIVVTSPGS